VASALLVHRPTVPLPLGGGRSASALAAAVSGVPVELLGPLMSSLDRDLLADDSAARALFAIPLHDFDAALEHALCEWEAAEPLRGR